MDTIENPDHGRSNYGPPPPPSPAALAKAGAQLNKSAAAYAKANKPIGTRNTSGAGQGNPSRGPFGEVIPRGK